MPHGTKHGTWELENAHIFIELLNPQSCCRDQMTRCV